MNTSTHNSIKNEYDKKQYLAFDDMMFRRSNAYNTVPRLEELDKQINMSGIRYNKMILMGTHPADQAISELQSLITHLKTEKARLLAEHGLPENYLDIQYSCPKCRDKGFIESLQGGAERCSCYRQQLVNQLYLQSNLRLTDKDNFSSFDESLYNCEVDEKKYAIKISPRDNIKNIKERCLKFIESFDNTDEKNLYFSGPTGVGKTFMSTCIAIELMNRGKTVLYQTAPAIYNIINEYKAKAYRDEDFEDSSYRSIYDVDLLIIDDLGTESSTASRYAEFLSIIDTRKANSTSRPCKTIISTNIGVKELYEYYDERIASRIIGDFTLLRFAGDDIRRLKKQQLK
jgi:DNA replication protein DnaC